MPSDRIRQRLLSEWSILGQEIRAALPTCSPERLEQIGLVTLQRRREMAANITPELADLAHREGV